MDKHKHLNAVGARDDTRVHYGKKGKLAEVVQVVDLASIFPRSQSNRASVGCAEQTSPIHGGPSLKLTGLKRSAANVSLPDTTAYLQRSVPRRVKAVLVGGENHVAVTEISPSLIFIYKRWLMLNRHRELVR